MSVTVDGASIVTSGGGYVRWSTDRTEYFVRAGHIGSAQDPTPPSQQVIQWAAGSSTRDSIINSLRAVGFTVTQIGGSREFLAQSFVFNSSAISASGNAALTFWEARG